MHVLPCRCTRLRPRPRPQPCSPLIRSALSGTERDVTLTYRDGAATVKVDVCCFIVKEVKDRKSRTFAVVFAGRGLNSQPRSF